MLFRLVMMAAAAGTAGVFPAFVVVVALTRRVIGKLPGQVRLHRFVGGTACTGHQRNAVRSQRLPGARADAAADEYRDAVCRQQARQRPVAVFPRVQHLLAHYLPVLRLIEGELLRFPEMLKNLAVLSRYCDLQCSVRFLSLFARLDGVSRSV